MTTTEAYNAKDDLFRRMNTLIEQYADVAS